MTLPSWLEPIAEAAERIEVGDLTRFKPPDEGDHRSSAVLMLFGEGPHGPDLVLTERAHTMRSHPGQVSFPGGAIDPGESAVEAALREAHEEIGLDPAGVEVFGTLPDLWVPPSNHAVTPVLAWWREPSAVSVISPEEVHAVYRVPIADLVDPAHRITVTGPSGWRAPGILIGDDKDVILWGFTGGIVVNLFEYVGWLTQVPHAPERALPDYMLIGRRGGTGGWPRGDRRGVAAEAVQPNTDFEERRESR